MSSFDTVIGDLSAVSAFLESHVEVDRAYRIRRDIELIESDPASAVTILSGLAYWGGSGSHADLFVESSGVAEPDADPNRAYSELLVRLGNDLIGAGIAEKRLSEWLDFLKSRAIP